MRATPVINGRRLKWSRNPDKPKRIITPKIATIAKGIAINATSEQIPHLHMRLYSPHLRAYSSFIAIPKTI
jgi:hypothetical protein